MKHNKSLFALRNEPDYGQTTTNPFILADRHIKGLSPTSYEVLNSVMAYHGLTLTREEFDYLSSITPIRLPFPLPKGDKEVIATIGSARNGAVKTLGAYVFTDKSNSSQYVGGSMDLANRVRYYNSPKGLSETRTIAKLILANTPYSFELLVYVIDPVAMGLIDPAKALLHKLVIALEQYLILDLRPKLNDLLVVGGTSVSFNGSAALAAIAAKKMKPVYMYNRDKSVLLYIRNSRRDFAKDIGINMVTLTRYLNKDKVLYGNYVFSDYKLDTAVVSLINRDKLRRTMADLYKNRMLLRDHSAKVNSNMHPITLTDLLSADKATKSFVSKTQASKYTASVGRVIDVKLFRRPLPFQYKGWLVESNIVSTSKSP
uniref:GIY-YIG domain-containing protein n=1 Tax=Tremella fuciformis TaxID=64657 RepID=A0A2H4QBK9_9TREE|nr:hypothetical protein [Tremella fuciformis]ATX62030.1 hypothetical protein [Tremella fuciformis]